MKTRNRFALVVSVFTLAALLLAVVATVFMRMEFDRIERQNIDNDTRRATNALQNQVEAMRVQVADWANWTDVYEFVHDHNQEFIDADLDNSAVQTLGLNFMLFIDEHGELVHQKSVDIDTGEDMALPSALIQQFDTSHGLLSNSETDEHAGYLGVDDHIVLFAARPILTSSREGPHRGTLVFARYLLPAEVDKLKQLTNLSLSYQQISTPQPLPDVQAVMVHLSGTSVTTRVVPGAKIAGYQVANDAFGRQLFVVRVEASRAQYLHARQALRYYLAALVGVVTLATVSAMYATRQMYAKDRVIRLKDEFFSMATHEIRTPLAAIRGYSQMLKQNYGIKNDKDFNEIVEDIYESSKRLIALVTNYLELARLEQNRLPVSISDVQLHPIAAKVIEEMQGMVSGSDVKLVADLPEELPLLRADGDRVKQVLYNLIGNAVKFTERGTVTVSARHEGGYVVVRVADTGKGIEPAAQAGLFEKFRQVNSSDSHGGSGLGLYISKMLVQRMGGAINIESSEIGRGTVMRFTVPVAGQATAGNSDSVQPSMEHKELG